MSKTSKALFWALLGACAALFFLPLGSRALWNPSEGFYAEIARDMLELKTWLSPHFNGELVMETPPLTFWLTAASMALFGQNESAARFWSAAFGLLTVGITYRLGKLWRGERAGALAGGVLATSLLFFSMTQYATPSMALAFWLTLALYACARILEERPPERVKHYADVLAVAMAGGFLTKGLIALWVPLVVLGLTLSYTRLGVQARKISWQPALMLLAFLTVPWAAVAAYKNPSFLRSFFIQGHLTPFFSRMPDTGAPFYYFVPALAAGFFPWSVFLPTIFLSAFKHRGVAMKREPVRALLVIWSLFVFLFMSLSRSKQAGDILPVLPALALLVGAACAEVLEEDYFPSWLSGGLAALVVLFTAGLCLMKCPSVGFLWKESAAAAFLQRSDALSLLLAFGVFIFAGTWGMRQSLACVGGILIVQVLFLSSLTTIAPALDAYLSNRGLGKVLAARAVATDRVVIYGVFDERRVRSLAFYAKRPVTIIRSGLQETLRGFPECEWVITEELTAKSLRQAKALASFEPAAREGNLLLFRNVR